MINPYLIFPLPLCKNKIHGLGKKIDKTYLNLSDG